MSIEASSFEPNIFPADREGIQGVGPFPDAESAARSIGSDIEAISQIDEASEQVTAEMPEELTRGGS